MTSKDYIIFEHQLMIVIVKFQKYKQFAEIASQCVGVNEGMAITFQTSAQLIQFVLTWPSGDQND